MDRKPSGEPASNQPRQSDRFVTLRAPTRPLRMSVKSQGPRSFSGGWVHMALAESWVEFLAWYLANARNLVVQFGSLFWLLSGFQQRAQFVGLFVVNPEYGR
ncbi:hypothetical protein EZI54_20735 [Marinobacter halodurans]|uniref:Uncharacterized protein n=1 Tax=Marinobacter halodurans TaxID=2528979 RepID=A0ABY1ZEM1_9GAMM|nr:hypothetical protein [Marinobacter halodurans]TBW48720.1 hypothetical protein EZI54_20735 [Marinobacter halodurans]